MDCGKKRHHPDGEQSNNSVTKRVFSRQVFAGDGLICNIAVDSPIYLDEDIPVPGPRYGQPSIGSEASSDSIVGDSCIDTSSKCLSTAGFVSEESTPARIQSGRRISDGGVKLTNSQLSDSDDLRSGWSAAMQSLSTSTRNNNVDSPVSSYLMVEDELSEGSGMQFFRYPELQGKMFLEVSDATSKGECFSFSSRQLSVGKSAISTSQTRLTSLTQSVSHSKEPMAEECFRGTKLDSVGGITHTPDLDTGLLLSEWVRKESVSQGDCDATSQTIIRSEDSSREEKNEEPGTSVEESSYMGLDVSQACNDHRNGLDNESGQRIVETAAPRYVLSSGRLSMEEGNPWMIRGSIG